MNRYAAAFAVFAALLAPARAAEYEDIALVFHHISWSVVWDQSKVKYTTIATGNVGGATHSVACGIVSSKKTCVLRNAGGATVATSANVLCTNENVLTEAVFAVPDRARQVRITFTSG